MKDLFYGVCVNVHATEKPSAEYKDVPAVVGCPAHTVLMIGGLDSRINIFLPYGTRLDFKEDDRA